ncbi:hypothetical protein A2U01_0057714, partial [Trifolium medium]|nr:hypothetical protein [Trifolium medium]
MFSFTFHGGEGKSGDFAGGGDARSRDETFFGGDFRSVGFGGGGGMVEKQQSNGFHNVAGAGGSGEVGGDGGMVEHTYFSCSQTDPTMVCLSK